jgi:hypothetical protein
VTKEEAPFVSASTIVIQNNKYLEERVLKLEETFREKFDSISILVEALENSLKHTIEQLKPEDVSDRLALLEEYSRIQQYRDELVEIDRDVRASEEAANWFDKNRRQLISYAQGHIFSDSYTLKRFAKVQVSREIINLFCQDLDSYFRWIGHHLRMGTTPREMPKGIIALVLPPEIYTEAFKIVKEDRVLTKFGLSARAVTMLRSSINRFLIKRNLKLDSPHIY